MSENDEQHQHGHGGGQGNEQEHGHERHTHHFDPERAGRLLNEERIKSMRFHDFLDELDVAPGQKVLELGCGPGLLLPVVAERVGTKGQVFGADVSTDMLVMARKRLQESGSGHINLVQSGESSLPLKDQLVDRIYCCYVLHELRQPSASFSELYRLLKPGGRLAALDWDPDGNLEEGPPPEHRLSAGEAGQYLESAGFTHVESRSWVDDLYFVTAQK